MLIFTRTNGQKIQLPNVHTALPDDEAEQSPCKRVQNPDCWDKTETLGENLVQRPYIEAVRRTATHPVYILNKNRSVDYQTRHAFFVRFVLHLCKDATSCRCENDNFMTLKLQKSMKEQGYAFCRIDSGYRRTTLTAHRKSWKNKCVPACYFFHIIVRRS